MTARGLLLSAAAAWALAAPAFAAVDFSGFWEPRADSRPAITPAKVTPWSQAQTDAERAAQVAGNVVNSASRWCHPLGPNMVLYTPSEPIAITQTKDRLLFTTETTSTPRHVYFDRDFPDMEDFDPTTNGFSVGHWEGDTLVIETKGFSERGLLAIPGGGRRTESSHLVERMHMYDNGRRLEIESTWTDPKVFLEPHTYRIQLYKMPAGTYAFEAFCDASDPERAGSVTGGD